MEPSAVDISLVDLDAVPTGKALAEEQSRADRMVNELARSRFLASRAALRLVLAGVLGVDPASIRFAHSARGRPSLAEGGDLSFSLSRSDGVALVAVTRGRAIGADVERITTDVDHDGLAERFFAAAESEMLRSLPESDRRGAFFRLWVRKEAVLKASGAGLADGLGHIDVREDLVGGQWSVASLDVVPGFAAAIAVEGPLGPITLRKR